MAKQVLFIHSGGPQGDQQGSSGLLRHLKNELGPGYEVSAPRMPDPENPKYSEWRNVLKEELAALEDGSILIGHSIGGSALFKILSEEELGKTFEKVISIAAPFWGMNEEWQLEDFHLVEDFSSRSSLLPDVVLFHSIGDDIVPFEHMERYMENLPKATVRQIPGNDHIFLDGLPDLADEIRKV
ncbi:alpha/beta hydrolase [Planococcus sp. MERTA32b]|nr:alpha/beta hydrolase [Planococcus sp. MER TA 32b]